MEDKIKNTYTILSGGKKVSSDEYIISSNHFNSITRDRFIAELNKNGLTWNGQDIPFGLLLKKDTPISQHGTMHMELPVQHASSNGHSARGNAVSNNSSVAYDNFSVGIDIQAMNELPACDDFWEDNFYKTKFKPEEIAYCVKKENPVQSFAGIYACKEALIKCNNLLEWDAIRITFTPLGKPSYSGYQVSISHSGDMAVAVAFRLAETIDHHAPNSVLQAGMADSPQPVTVSPMAVKRQPVKMYLLVMVMMMAVIAYFIYRDFVVSH